MHPRKSAPKQHDYKDPLEYLELIVSRIEDARLDLTTSYDDWMRCAFSMATFGNSGREYFHRISSINSEYNSKDADAKFENAKDTTRWTSPGWFYTHAKRNGIDLSYPRKEDPGFTTAQKKTVKKPLEKESKTLPDPSIIDSDIRWPDYIKFVPEEKAVAEKSVRNFSFFQYNNRMYTARYKENEITFGRPVSNFSIKPFYQVTDEEGQASRIIQFTNVRNQSILARVPSDAFTSVNEFSKFVFTGNFHHSLKNPEFVNIRGKIFDDCIPAHEISTLGWQDDGFFAFANGIYANGKFLHIDSNGVVEYNEHRYFLPAMSSIYKDQKKKFQFERTFVYVERSVSFVDWASLFCKVYGENGRIGLMFYIMSVYSDLIFKVDGCFPMLFLYGKPDSGKTTMAISMLSMFHPTGEKTVGVNINNVPMPALFRTLAQARNAIVLIEEYQNDLEKFKIENLKGIWNRTPPTKTDTTQSNTSNRTVSTPPESAAVLTGQHLPNQDVALFTRVMLLSYFKSTDFTTEQRDNYRQLRELQSGSLTQLTTRVLSLRQQMVDQYQEVYDKEKKSFAGTFSGSNVSRIGQHCSMVMATYKTVGASLKLPFTEQELRDTVVRIANDQTGMMRVSEESNLFWEIVESLVHSGLIKEKEDFVFRSVTSVVAKKHGEKTETSIQLDGPTELLVIRLSYIHGLYMKEMRMQNRKGAMDKPSLEQYLENSSTFIGQKKSFRFKHGPTSAFIFNYTQLSEMFGLKKSEDDSETSEAELMMPVDKTGNAQDIARSEEGAEGDLPF
jgi:hypothetical protein